VFTRAKIAVFVDGCFWHGCPAHHTVAKTNADFWAAKVGGNQSRDRETDRLLTEAGWLVVRVWEHEAADAAAQRVLDAWRSRTPVNHPLSSSESGPTLPLAQRQES
jgi:DNA mismatch endonuclease (patch repair protein)